MKSNLVKIRGYVTDARIYMIEDRPYNRGTGFTLCVLSDNVENEQGKHPNISKEFFVAILNLYPNDIHTRLENVEKRREQKTRQYEYVQECISICKGLRKGALVDCEVFIVNTVDNNDDTTTYEINTDPTDRVNYSEHKLILYANPNFFKHLDEDTPETLKFRRQNYCIETNIKNGFDLVGGSDFAKYLTKWWIDKNPKLIAPIFWWIWIKSQLHKLWKRFIGKESPISIAAKGVAIIIGGFSLISEHPRKLLLSFWDFIVDLLSSQ